MRSDDLKIEIDVVKKAIAPLSQKLMTLQRQLNEALSREFIKVNGITLKGVQFSSGDGVPWYGTIDKFGKWLKDTNCQKRWCEWNGEILSVAELIQGRFIHTNGMVEHLQ